MRKLNDNERIAIYYPHLEEPPAEWAANSSQREMPHMPQSYYFL